MQGRRARLPLPLLWLLSPVVGFPCGTSAPHGPPLVLESSGRPRGTVRGVWIWRAAKRKTTISDDLSRLSHGFVVASGDIGGYPLAWRTAAPRCVQQQTHGVDILIWAKVHRYLKIGKAASLPDFCRLAAASFFLTLHRSPRRSAGAVVGGCPASVLVVVKMPLVRFLPCYRGRHYVHVRLDNGGPQGRPGCHVTPRTLAARAWRLASIGWQVRRR